MTSKPFKQGRFRDLPEKPRLPHRFFETDIVPVRLESEHFGSTQVHVRRAGNGPPLLLVHGLMTTSYSWRYAFEPLSQHFTCYMPDLIGAGRTDKPLDVSYGPTAIAEWIAELMRELDIHGCAVIGNSMGGYLAMHLALRDAAAMSRLVVLHAPGIPELRLSLVKALRAVPGPQALVGRIIRRWPLRWAHRNVHYFDESLKSLEEAREYGGPLATSDGVRALFKHIGDAMGIDAMRRFHKELRARRTQPFPIPLQLIYARRDPMVAPEIGVELAKLIPSAQFEWLEDASHFAHVDATDAFLDRALPFLTG